MTLLKWFIVMYTLSFDIKFLDSNVKSGSEGNSKFLWPSQKTLILPALLPITKTTKNIIVQLTILCHVKPSKNL